MQKRPNRTGLLLFVQSPLERWRDLTGKTIRAEALTIEQIITPVGRNPGQRLTSKSTDIICSN